MAKILIILTGGTIGSLSSGKAIDTDRRASVILLEEYFRQYGHDDEFVTAQPLNILSENLETRHWETLVNFILEYDITGFDGMIITHGSDTLSYSSAMLSMCLCHLPLPIVITAANYIVTDEHSNALNNLRSSVALIKLFARGVFTVFGEKTGKSRVFLPTRLLEADALTDTFQSFGGGELGFVDGEVFEPTPLSINPSKSQIESRREKTFSDKLSLCKNILMIRSYPGFNYNDIVINDTVGAVLIVPYHSQTARTQGKGSVSALIDRCHKRNIPVYCAPFKGRDKYYKTSLELLELGCIPLYAISPESAYCKLLIACSMDIGILDKDIYFEEIIESDNKA